MGCGTSQNKNKTSLGNPKGNEEAFPPKKGNEPSKVNEAEEAKSKIIEVTVIFHMNDGLTEKRTFQSNTLIEAIIKDAESKLPNNWEKSQLLMTHEGKNLKDLSSKKFEEISKGKTEIKIEVKLVGLPIAQDFFKEFSKISVIAKPLYDTHEVVIYDIQSLKISVESHAENLLKNFNHTSSYCNGADNLFLSGGDLEVNSENILSNYFLQIDLKGHLSSSTEESRQGLIHPRKSHSMIYIPNEYVFIVGGSKCLKVEYYDLKNKNCVDHSELNEERIEPSLSLIDNSSLYCFTGLKTGKDHSKTFERIKLRTNSTKWEKVEVKFDQKVSNFSQMFFAVTYFKSDSVIFLGGVDFEQSKNNYAFNYRTNTLYLTEQIREEYEFSEKFFIPIQKSTGIVLPNFHDRELKLLVWNNESLQKAEFEI